MFDAALLLKMMEQDLNDLPDKTRTAVIHVVAKVPITTEKL